MSDRTKWLDKLAAQLPRQKAGNSASQFGSVSGNVTIVNLTLNLQPDQLYRVRRRGDVADRTSGRSLTQKKYR